MAGRGRALRPWSARAARPKVRWPGTGRAGEEKRSCRDDVERGGHAPAPAVLVVGRRACCSARPSAGCGGRAVKLNAVERAAMNNPVRAAHQQVRESAWFRRLADGDLAGKDVLEVGCGRGVGVEVLLDRLSARHVTAFDLDDAMVDLARRRLADRSAAVDLDIGDVTHIAHVDETFDAVANFGTVHHVPDWRRAVAEVARVLRPGGLFLFEEVPRHTLDTWLLRTFTAHPREDRFEADEFTAELARHGLHGRLERRFGGGLFVGAATKEG